MVLAASFAWLSPTNAQALGGTCTTGAVQTKTGYWNGYAGGGLPTAGAAAVIASYSPPAYCWTVTNSNNTSVAWTMLAGHASNGNDAYMQVGSYFPVTGPLCSFSEQNDGFAFDRQKVDCVHAPPLGQNVGFTVLYNGGCSCEQMIVAGFTLLDETSGGFPFGGGYWSGFFDWFSSETIYPETGIQGDIFHIDTYSGLASQTIAGWSVPPNLAIFNNHGPPYTSPPGVIVPYAPAYNVFGAYQGTS
ncbi:MAG TPA: hypothetical protein VIB48_15820 [Acidimicrobiia bacterium]